MMMNNEYYNITIIESNNGVNEIYYSLLWYTVVRKSPSMELLQRQMLAQRRHALPVAGVFWTGGHRQQEYRWILAQRLHALSLEDEAVSAVFVPAASLQTEQQAAARDTAYCRTRSHVASET